MKSNKHNPFLLFAAITLAVSATSITLHGQTNVRTWDGDAGTGNLDTASNWSNNTLPSTSSTNGDQMRFDGGTGPSTRTFGQLTFNGGSGLHSVLVTGNQTSALTLNATTSGGGFRLRSNINIQDGAGAFSMGTGGETFLLNIPGDSATFTFTNNSDNLATIGSQASISRSGTGFSNPIFTGSGDWLVEGPIFSSVSNMSKTGAGKLTINRNAGSVGNFTISGGTLQLGNGGTVGAFTNAGFTGIVNNASLVFNRGSGSDLTHSAPISGTGSVTQAGLNALTLAGTHTYEGATTVSAGTLYVTGALSNSAVTVEANATIGGTGSLGNGLAFAGTSFLEVVDLNDALAVAGTITFDSGFGIDNLLGIDWDSLDLNTAYTVLSTGQEFDELDIANFGFANRVPVGSSGREAYFTNGSLAVIVIPEPAAALLGSLGMLLLLRRRRHA